MSVSSGCDLQARDGKHSHSKVMVFGCTLAAFLVLIVTFAVRYVWTWPAVAAFLGFLWAPCALDVIKSLAKIIAAVKGLRA